MTERESELKPKHTLYAPDNSGDWEDLGSGSKKRWPNGIPSFISNEREALIYQEYAGNVWVKRIPHDMNPKEPK